MATIDEVFEATAFGDGARLTALLDADGPLLRAVKRFKGSLLHVAGSMEVTRLLLDRGLDPNGAGWMGARPLHNAAERGDAATVALLLERGADVNARRERDDTPLFWAKTAEVTRTLLTAGADPDARDFSERVPLHWAAQFGHVEVIGALLAHGCPVDPRDDNGRTPLHWAADSRHREAVEALLAAGAGPNAQSANGTPLHVAAHRNDIPLCETLLRHGANLAARNPARQTAYQVAVEGNGAGVLFLAGGSEEGDVRAFLRERMEAAFGTTNPGSAGPVLPERLRLHPTGPEAVTLNRGGSLTRWTLEGDTARIVDTVQTPHSSVRDFDVSSSDALIALSAPADAVELRRWDDLAETSSVPLPGAGGVYSVAWAPDGRHVTAGVQEELFVVSAASREVVARIGMGVGNLAIGYAPDGARFAVAWLDQGSAGLEVASVQDGVPVGHPEDDFGEGDDEGAEQEEDAAPDGPVSVRLGEAGVYPFAVRFSPDGRRILIYHTCEFEDGAPKSEGWRGALTLYDLPRQEVLWTTQIDAALTGDARSIAEAGYEYRYVTEPGFLPDGRVVCGSTRGALLCFDAETGALAQKLLLDADVDVYSVAVSPNGARLWAALGDGTVRAVSLA